jgi:hypothetical protein
MRNETDLIKSYINMGCCEVKSENIGVEVNVSFRGDADVVRGESAEFRDVSMTSDSTPYAISRSQLPFARSELSFILSTSEITQFNLLTPKFTEMPNKKNSPKFSFASNPTTEETETFWVPTPPQQCCFEGVKLPEILQESLNEFELSDYSPSLSP